MKPHALCAAFGPFTLLSVLYCLARDGSFSLWVLAVIFFVFEITRIERESCVNQ